MSTTVYQFKAFISYSHAADGRLAPALQSALHRFAKPWYRLRAIRVFRDKTNLSANPGLWSNIQESLGQSEFLLLMASPASAASKWVRQELEYWLTNRDPQNLLILCTDGEIAWDGESGDFDWSRTTALPDVARGKFAQEPLYLDLSFAKGIDQLSTRHPEFLDRVATVAAALHGRPKDEIFGEDVRRHRQVRRVVWLTVLTLTVLLAVAATLGIMSYIRGVKLSESLHETTLQKLAAEQQTRVAVTERLAAQAVAAKPRFPQRALALAVEAVRTPWPHDPFVPAAEQILRDLLAETSPGVLRGSTGRPRWLALSPDGRLLAVVDRIGPLRVWRLDRPGEAATIFGGPQAPLQVVALSDRGQLVAAGAGAQPAPAKSGLVLRRWDQPETPAVPLGGELPRRHGHGTFSPDGSLLVITGDEGRAWLWRLARPDAAPEELKGHEGDVITVAFSPDGRWLATGSGETSVLRKGRRQRVGGTVLLWRLDQPGSPPVRVSSSVVGSVVETAFSPDSRWLAAIRYVYEGMQGGAGGGGVGVWKVDDLGGGQATPHPTSSGDRTSFQLEHKRQVNAVAFSPVGGLLAAADMEGVRVWQLGEFAKPLALLTGQVGTTLSLAFGPDGRTLAVGSEDGSVRVWGVGKPTFKPSTASIWRVESPDPWETVVVLRGHDGSVRKLGFNSEGTILVSAGDDGAVRLWHAGRPMAQPAVLRQENPVAMRAATADSRGTEWATADYQGIVRVWGADRAPTPRQSFPTGKEPVQFLAYTRDDRHLITVDSNGLARSWKADRPQDEPVTLGTSEGYASVAALSPDGKWLLIGGGHLQKKSGGHVKIYNLERTAEPPVEPSLGSSGIEVGQFGPDGHTFVVAGREATWVGRLDRPTDPPVKLPKHTGIINAVAFSPDGRWLATAGNDGAVRVWQVDDLGSPRLERTPHVGPVSAVAFSPDGRFLATGGGSPTDLRGDGVRLWRMDRLEATPTVLRGHVYAVTLLRFSPDSKLLVTGGTLEDLLVWRPEAPAVPPVALPTLGRTGVVSASFESTGKLLSAACEDGAIRTWEMTTDGLIRCAGKTAARNLTQDEWSQYFPGEAYRPTFPDMR